MSNQKNDRPNVTVKNAHSFAVDSEGVKIDARNSKLEVHTGVDPHEFVTFAGYLLQVSATLGLEDSARNELETLAQQLHVAATSESPEPGRLRALTNSVRNSLTSAAATIAGQTALEMGQRALDSLD